MRLVPNFGSPRVGVNLVGDNAFLGVAAAGRPLSSSPAADSLWSGGGLYEHLDRPLIGGVDPFVAISIALLIGAPLWNRDGLSHSVV
jgi:hypothetical protein